MPAVAAAISAGVTRSAAASLGVQPSKRAVWSSSAESPPARTAAMIPATAGSTREVLSRTLSSSAAKPGSKAASLVSSRIMQAGRFESRSAPRACGAAGLRGRIGERGPELRDPGADRLRPGLQRGAVDDEAGGDVVDHLGLD